MIILDTDALGHVQKKDPVGLLIESGLDASPDPDIRITAVTAYEMMGGAVALIDRRKKERRDPIPAFHLLQDLVEYLGRWRGRILPYETAAEQIYQSFPAQAASGVEGQCADRGDCDGLRCGGLDLQRERLRKGAGPHSLPGRDSFESPVMRRAGHGCRLRQGTDPAGPASRRNPKATCPFAGPIFCQVVRSMGLPRSSDKLQDHRQ